MANENLNLIEKVMKSVSEEGVSGCAVRTGKFIKKQIKIRKSAKPVYKDILFISGCGEDLPHPWRYRVIHQREQLESCGFSTDEVYYQDLSMNQLRYYRAFVFFRCPYTELTGKFAAAAKRINKRIIYDVDDLVIDTKYTDQIPFVQSMDAKDRQEYDENVRSMQRLLRNCDMAVTTTGALADELKQYVPEVYINRNTASEEMVRLSREAILTEKIKDRQAVRIGYFSGSITHNADIEMILPVLAEILEQYKETELYLAGEVDLPEILRKYEGRIVQMPFADWRKLPKLIAGVDINLAPLEDTIFNRAKSENKWVEAALVKVATIASDTGAFHDCIENGKTGILCSTMEEWKTGLKRLITDESYRNLLAEQAYRHCLEHCTTVRRGMELARYYEEKIPGNYGFVLPGLEISGGMKVALQHAAMLRDKGKDVVLFTLDNPARWLDHEGKKFPVLSLKHTELMGNIGCAVATMWTTLPFVVRYPNISRRCYLVQNYETDFYSEGDPLRIEANKTYMPHNRVEFLTISRWCQKWLKEYYGQNASYAPNGLDSGRFACRKRTLGEKIRILIEGDCGVDYKNVDEAFRIVRILDLSRYEIWYMSYNAEPKDWYHVDRFLHKVPYEQVPEVYDACDILLKTSLLESFSYPPLEMMASGGYVVAVPNGGNAEYLQDERNCLLYPAGDLQKAKEQIERICRDEMLQEELYQNSRKTVEGRDWSVIREDILELYL